MPTGSMAPTLLGFHKELTCPNCRFPFVIGMDDQGRSGRPVCPNCGQEGLGDVPAVECNGDRLLVQKFLFDVRAPDAGKWPSSRARPSPTRLTSSAWSACPARRSRSSMATSTSMARSPASRSKPSSGRCASWSSTTTTCRPTPTDSPLAVPARPLRAGLAERLEGRGDAVRPRTDRQDLGDREDWLEYRHFDPDRSRIGADPRLLPVQRRRRPGRQRRQTTSWSRPTSRSGPTSRRSSSGSTTARTISRSRSPSTAEGAPKSGGTAGGSKRPTPGGGLISSSSEGARGSPGWRRRRSIAA